MLYLTSEAPGTPGKTRIDVYKTKQAAYTSTVERRTKAFAEALDLAKSDPRNDSLSKQRQAYDTWVSQNQKTYRNLVQAAYMDWVSTGKKVEVEYHFAIIDNDSAMARVEASKVIVTKALTSLQPLIM